MDAVEEVFAYFFAFLLLFYRYLPLGKSIKVVIHILHPNHNGLEHCMFPEVFRFCQNA